jgi:methylenetetrahydrofolate reductase (NADPH)
MSPAIASAELGRAELLSHWSFEITSRDVDHLDEIASLVPQGTQVSVTFLPNEDFKGRVQAARAIRRLGFEPMPHVPARYLRSRTELDNFLASLAGEAEIRRVFVVAGDLASPLGPFADALDVISSGVLGRHGVRHVGVAGYPEGHPNISEDRLWDALLQKQKVLGDLGHEMSVITQFGFDAAPILTWVERLRSQGVDAPLRLGIPGPTNIRTLLKFAARCGVGASAKVMAKYGVSLSRLFGSAGPDPLIDGIADGLTASRHQKPHLHFFPFGGLLPMATWVRDYRASLEQ